MSKSTKNTVEVRVPRKRDGFKDHKTTVRMRVLPEFPAGAPSPDGPKKPAAPGPEALGLPPHGPRVKLPTTGPSPVVEPDGYEPATWRFLLLNLEDGKVTFDDANWATSRDYRDEYFTVRIANNLDAGQAVGFAADNEELLQGILDAKHFDDGETLTALEAELQSLADELVTNGGDLERAIDELTEENTELVKDGLEWALLNNPVKFAAQIDTAGGEVRATITDPYGNSAQFVFDAHPDTQGDLNGDASEAVDDFKSWIEENFVVALGAEKFDLAGFENPQKLAEKLLRGELEVSVHSLYDTENIDDDEDGNEVEPVRIEAYLEGKYLEDVSSLEAVQDLDVSLWGVDLTVGDLWSDNGGELGSIGDGEYQLVDTFRLIPDEGAWPAAFFENNS